MVTVATRKRPPQEHRDTILDPEDLVGRHVSLAYNIPRCVRRRPNQTAACYSVRFSQAYKRGPIGSWRPGKKVMGYVRRIVLRDVRWWVSQAGIDAIRRPSKKSGKPQRSVCCYALGVVASSGDAARPSFKQEGWEAIGFNPFRHRCFVVKDEICVRESDWAVFAIDPTRANPMLVYAFGNSLGAPYGPGRFS